MTQATPTIGANKSGVQYRSEDNDGKKALLNHHKGSTAPSYAEAGILWLDDAATPWLLKVYDGADWIVMAAINATANTIEAFHGAAGLRVLNYATDIGAANAYAVTPSPAITAYVTGQVVTLKPANAGTGAATLNVNALGAKNIKLLDGSNPASGALLTTGIYQLVYDGTNFVLLNPSLGSAAYLTAGTSANNLVQLDGSAKLPAVDGSALTNLPAGAQTVVLLATATASNSASLDFLSVIGSAYSEYLFIGVGIVPASDQLIHVLTSSNNSTFDTGASDYAYSGQMLGQSSGVSNASSAGDTKVKLVPFSVSSTAANGGISFQLRMVDPSNTTKNKMMNWAGSFYCAATTEYAEIHGMGVRLYTGAVNAVRFISASGNITSGKIYMYGVKNT